MTLPSPVYTLSLHHALPISRSQRVARASTPGKSPTPWFLRGRCGRGPRADGDTSVLEPPDCVVRKRALHEPDVPERGSVTRRTWGCSNVLRLTEPRSHRAVR